MSQQQAQDLLEEYQGAFRVPVILFEELVRRGALPRWVAHEATLREDWLSSLHRNVTSKNWPQWFQEAVAGLVERSNSIAEVALGDAARAIVMPISTPAQLRAILEILNYPFVSPNSSDPQATMSINMGLMDETARRLSRLIGMLKETGFTEAEDTQWGGAVILGTRFLYYHELAHMMCELKPPMAAPEWILPGEEDIAEELACDQLALGMLVTETRSYPDLQAVAFSAVSLVMSLLAAREFAATGGGTRRIRKTFLRMHRLLHWGKLSVEAGLISSQSLKVGEFYWEHFLRLLRLVNDVPSPLMSLLVETTRQPITKWGVASNHVVKWCVFGDRMRVLRTVRGIRDSAMGQASQCQKARDVLRLVDYLLEDTAHLEPELGLKARLEP